MKKLSVILAVMACFGLMLGACGDDDNGGPTCQDPPATCDPECTAPEICCGTTCQEMETCDPECTAPDYCHPCDGGCVTVTLCDPECTAPAYCDTSDGTCVTPPCGGDCDAKQEACIDDVCVACDPVCSGDQFCAE